MSQKQCYKGITERQYRDEEGNAMWTHEKRVAFAAVSVMEAQIAELAESNRLAKINRKQNDRSGLASGAYHLREAGQARRDAMTSPNDRKAWIHFARVSLREAARCPKPRIPG